MAMFFLRLLTIIGMTGIMSGAVFADDSKIEFDGTAKENPSSPAGGELRASGTYKVGAGLEYQFVEVMYRKAGDESWIVEKDKVKVGNKDGKSTWEITLTNVPPGEYEVLPHLFMKNAQGDMFKRDIEKTRKVKVKAKTPAI